MATSSHDIRLEPLRRRTEQLGHGGEIPITFLGPDVPERDGEVGEQGVDVLALLLPASHTGDGKRMPKRHQARATRPLGSLEAQTPTEPRTPGVQRRMTEWLALFRHQEGLGYGIIVPVCAAFAV